MENVHLYSEIYIFRFLVITHLPKHCLVNLSLMFVNYDSLIIKSIKLHEFINLFFYELLSANFTKPHKYRLKDTAHSGMTQELKVSKEPKFQLMNTRTLIFY